MAVPIAIVMPIAGGVNLNDGDVSYIASGDYIYFQRANLAPTHLAYRDTMLANKLNEIIATLSSGETLLYTVSGSGTTFTLAAAKKYNTGTLKVWWGDGNGAVRMVKVTELTSATFSIQYEDDTDMDAAAQAASIFVDFVEDMT